MGKILIILYLERVRLSELNLQLRLLLPPILLLGSRFVLAAVFLAVLGVAALHRGEAGLQVGHQVLLWRRKLPSLAFLRLLRDNSVLDL